jgi:high-affinity iron transporter
MGADYGEPPVRKRVRRIAASIATVLWLAAAAAAEPDTPTAAVPGSSDEAARLVFLLQYVGSDYAAAVHDGRVVDAAEYRENREFATLIGERYARLREAVPAAKRASLDEQLSKLPRLIADHADPRLVREVAEVAIPRLVEAFDLRAFPRERPDTEHAAKLFAENCATCHGPTGGGDGPRAKEIDPPPARFTDRNRMDGTAPYLFYNAITFGVANTAMASFAEGLSDQERWDLAFYLWSFVLPAGQRPPPAEIVLSLRDLATRSSQELAPEVVRQAVTRGETLDAAAAALRVAELRAHPPTLSDAQERLARLRQDLSHSVSLVEHGDAEGAVDVVTTAYLTEFEPLEPEINRRDSRIRQDFERSLIEFRGALRRNDHDGALRIANKLGDTIDRAVDLLDGKGEGRSRWRSPTAWLIVMTLLALTAVVLAVRRIGKVRAVR